MPNHLPGLTLRVFPKAAEMSRFAAEMILSAVKAKPDLLLCASAGGTPTSTYNELARHYARRPSSVGKVRILQIDEWAGLKANSPFTCAADLRGKLIGPLNIPKARCCYFQSNAPSAATECRRISQWLARNGPIDLCILGLGLNGHI